MIMQPRKNGILKVGLRGFLVVASSIVLAGNVSADETFAERFEEEQPGEAWHIESELDPPALRWHEPGRKRGLHFRAEATSEYVKNHDYAWREWNVGTEPFELLSNLHLESGLEQEWFMPGIAIALTSAPPGKMGEDDIAVTLAAQMAGLTASVRKGGFYNLVQEGHGALSQLRDNVLSDLVPRGGGRIHSRDWPKKHLEDSRLRFSIRRDEDDTIHYKVLWPALPGDRGRPYWTDEWDMPEDIARIPLRYVSIKQIPSKQEHAGSAYAGFTVKGVIEDMQGWLLKESPPPVVEDVKPSEPAPKGGTEAVIAGEGFEEGCSVRVGNKEAQNTTFVSENELHTTLPQLETGTHHEVSVTNPDGLFDILDPGVPYGRFVEEIRPRSAHPDGGDAVEFHGSGFDEDTQVSIGNKTAVVVEITEPTRMLVRVPEGEVGSADISVQGDEYEFSGTPDFGYSPHPYLYFTEEELPELREKFQSDMFAHYRRRILERADKHLESSVDQGDNNASVGATTSLAFSYVLTEEEKYRDKLIEVSENGMSATSYKDFGMMSVAGMAIAYDILYRDLSRARRADFQDYLDRMLEGYMRELGSWQLGGSANFSNTVPVGNSGGMLTGLVLMHCTPEAGGAVDAAAEKARLWPDICLSPNGGCREGVQYWDFGGSFYLILAHALNNATGDDRGLLDHPHLEKNVNFIRTQLGGHGGLFAFNDTKRPFLDGAAICADLGSRFDQPLMLWVADRAAEGGGKTRSRDTWAPFAFLWRSTQKAPEQFPGVPNLAYLEDMNWGAMRSDGSQFKPELVIGVKGGEGPLTHHKQKDIGSFVLQAHGEAKLIDPGYYEPKPTDHTLPLVDGEGPGESGSRIVESKEEGPWRMMTIDSTDGYGSAAKRVRRTIVMHGADGAVVLDDIIPAEGRPGRITAQYQTAWTPRIQDDDPSIMVMQGQKGNLLLRCFGHDIKLEGRARDFSSGWHWKKIAQEGDWQSVSGEYDASPERPMVTVLIPFKGEKMEQQPLCSYGERNIQVDLSDRVSVAFKRIDGQWEFELK